MLRIIGGQARGVHLKTPKWQGTRPMTDRVREAVFNILGPDVAGARVLDLYAGTGAVGLEALSRGAASVVAVDMSGKCAQLIRENARLAKLDKYMQVHKQRVETFIQQRLAVSDQSSAKTTDQVAMFDLIFFTPPYAIFSFDLLCQAGDLLSANRTLVAEMATRDPIDGFKIQNSKFTMQSVREYGDTRVMFLIKSS